MKHTRLGHACGIVNDPTDGKQKVIVAGTIVGDGNSTEIFDGENWMELPRLPGDAISTKAVVFDNRFFLISKSFEMVPKHAEILEYSFAEEAWIPFRDLVHGPRFGHASFLVPEIYCQRNQ